MKIAKVIGREIYDACGWPTLECEISLADGSYVTASVPTGISKSKHEAYELRDGGQRMSGRGVLKAVDTIESVIAPILIGQEPNLVSMDLAMIELDGTTNKSKLGANAMLATSMALLRAHASVEGMEIYELVGYLCEYNSVTLPFAMFNCISGGAHAPGNVRIQELMVIPIGSQSFRNCMEAAVTLHHHLYGQLKKKFDYVATSIEGALQANFKSDAQALDMLLESIEAVQKATNHRYFISLDVAASQFYDKKTHKYNWDGKKSLESEELIDLYERIIKKYPIFSIEDGLSELDEKGWSKMMDQLDNVQLIGDDLFASNPNLIANGIENGLATGAVIKPNQIGTITETLQAIKLCREYELSCILSHRSCDTNDTMIVDIAVGTSAGYIKAGGTGRGEHVAKYNDLLRIEDTLMLSILNS